MPDRLPPSLPPPPPAPGTPPKGTKDRLPGAFNYDVGSPAGAVRASQASKESSDDFISGLGQFLFGENNNSMLGGVPLLGPAVRAASAVPGVKLVSDVAGYAVGGGIALASDVAHRVPMGWIPGGTDDIFNSLPKTAEWEAVNEASNNDLLGGGNQKFDYVQKLIKDSQEGISGTSAGFLNVSPESAAGPGGSLAQFLMQTIGLFQGGQRVVERTIAGVPKILSGMDRVEETLARAAAGETDLSPAEMVIVNKVGTGEWSKDRGLDFLSSHGGGLSHDKALQLVGTFATDPAVLLSLGSGAMARLAMTGAKVAEGAAAGVSLSRVQRAGLAAYGLTSSELGPVAKTARAIFDPLSAFTKMGPATSAGVDLFVSNVAVKDFHAAFGRGAHDVYRFAREMGIEKEVMDAAAGRGTTIAVQLLAARRQATAVAMGFAERLVETVPRGSVTEDLLRRAPRNIGQMVREHTQRTWKYLWGDPGSEDRLALAKQYATSFGGDEARYIDQFNKMSDDALAFAHNVLYAQDERTVRLAIQEGAREYTGSTPYERLNMVNDTSMHDLGARSIRDDLKKSWSADELKAGGFSSQEEAQVALVRDWQKRFPELQKYVIDETNPQKAIKWLLDDLERGLKNGTIPHMVTADEMAKMPQAVQDVMAKLEHRILAFRPEDAVLWNLERNGEGLLSIAGNPWVEHLLEGVTYRPGYNLTTNLAGQVIPDRVGKALDWLESGSNLLLKRISSTAARENAMQRTVKYGVQKLGLQEEVVRDIFRRLTEHLDVVDKMTVRSLTAADIWDVARAVVPRNSGVGKREILAMVLDGFEGDLRYVGLPIKFTGRMKKLIAKATGYESNFAGQVSENFYNMLRFRYNPLFQTQEFFEPWVLNSQRGVSMANRGREADVVAEAVRRNLVNTSVIRQGDTDAVELGAGVLAGQGVVRALNQKRSLFSRLIFQDVQGTKRFAQLRGIMAGQGRAVREAWEQAGMGDEWVNLKKAYSEMTGEVVDDNEAALRWLAEQQAANLDMGIDLAARPGQRLMNFDDLIADIERWAPEDLGKLRSLSLDSMARRVAYIGEHKIGGIDDLRRLLANGDLSVSQVSDALREIKAPPQYISRVERALNFHNRDFWDQAREMFNMTRDELRAMQAYVAAAAKTQDMKPAEFLSQIVSANIVEGKGGVKMGKELADIERALSVLRAPKEGATAADLANQLGSIFWHHMHPSGRAAMFESLAKTQVMQADQYARQIAAETPSAIRRSKMRAPELIDEFMQRNPEYTWALEHEVETGAKAVQLGLPAQMPIQVSNRLGPGFQAAPAEVQERVLRVVLNVQDEFPGIDFGLDIYPIEHVGEGRGLASAGTRGITMSDGTGGDNVILLTDRGYAADSAEYWKRVRGQNADQVAATGLREWVGTTPESDIIHELAHVIDAHLRLGLGEARDPVANKIAKDWVKEFGPSSLNAENRRVWDKISRYSKQQIPKSGLKDEEGFAELFALVFDPVHRSKMTEAGMEDVYALGESFKQMLFDSGIYKPNLTGAVRHAPPKGFYHAPPEDFLTAITSAAGKKKSNGRLVGETITVYTEDEYRKMRTFLSDDMKTGYAITPDGELVSVFNVGKKGRIGGIIESMPGQGATKLNAFDEGGRLPELYGKAGFTETSRAPFDPNLAPKGWSGGAPDYVEMEHPSHVSAMRQNPREARWTPEMTNGLLERAARGTADPNPEVERAYQYFSKWARAVLAKGALEPGDRGVQLLNNLSGIPTTHATPYNGTHAAMMDAVTDRIRQLENDTYRMQYFARDRSLLERSINHPFFGLYPASYMWFKIMPEMVRFVAKEPFGLQTGAMLYSLMDVEKAIAIQREYDPEFDAQIEKVGHSAALWFLGYMLPATPWDIPSVAPSWARDLSAQGLANQARVEAGQEPKDYNFWSPVNRVKDFISPMRSADQTNRVLKEVGNIVGGSPTEQAKGGGARTFPVVGPFPNEEASPVQQLAAPLTDAVDELGKILSGV